MEMINFTAELNLFFNLLVLSLGFGVWLFTLIKKEKKIGTEFVCLI